MDGKITVSQLAKQLNMSKTTVSKAINNCPGILPQTKERVVQAAMEHGYPLPRRGTGVLVVLPAVPDYFWGGMRKHISAYAEAAGIASRCFVFHDLRDEADALRCIRQAVTEETTALLIAPPDTLGIRAELEELAKRLLVILLEESLPVKNIFFVGEDPWAQGRALGREYLHRCPQAHRFAAVCSTGFHTETARVAGFQAALEEANLPPADVIHIHAGPKLQSAHIARELAQREVLPECILCPSGNLASTCLAVRKLKTEQRVDCIGFDVNREALDPASREILCLAMVQDIGRQAETSVAYVQQYLDRGLFPVEKNTHIPGILLCTDPGGAGF